VASESLDAVVVGAGPNGLTAAVTLAAAGVGVRVFEANDGVGGGARTAELTLPGFHHDRCSAVHPLAAGSPVFATLPLADHGLSWLEPPLALAHPLDDGPAARLERSLADTAAGLGPGGPGYRALLTPFVGQWGALAPDVLRPFASVPPRHPALLARFGARALLPLTVSARRLRGDAGPALLAGMAAHTGSPLTAPVSTGPALMLALAAHDVGWPSPRGGAQAIADALAGYLAELGGSIVTGHRVRSLDELPTARAYLLDVSPWALPGLAGRRLPRRWLRRLGRYRRGPGVFKLDYALSGPVPWRDEATRRAGTVHLGGTLPEVAAALAAISRGEAPDRPLVVSAQPSLVDPSRAPAGRHTFWAYAHVPNGWPGDLTDAIEGQIERFAPGFRDVVLARAVSPPGQLERQNANLVGGDIADGAVSGAQALFRPLVAAVPYATPDPAVFLCSAATPPGPGVHGVCGHEAARVALRRVFGRRAPRFQPPGAASRRERGTNLPG
jgi:phytoene dehydrogenase-like protein